MITAEFFKKFTDEQSCITHLKELREKQGITCKKCETKTKHYWLEKIQKFQCSKCNSRTNLTAGTMMYKSKLPLLTWFKCIHFMTATKKPISALEMQRQLELCSYGTTWDMMRKVRMMMGRREERYKLKGTVETDEGFFEVVDLPKRDKLGNRVSKVKTLSRGRGSQRQSPVLVSVESTPVQHNFKHKKKRIMGFVKMEVLESCSSEDINKKVEKCIDSNSHVVTDGWNGYNKVTDVVKSHKKMKVTKKEVMTKLPWVHTQISNIKKELLGTHHSIGKGYLQLYLNEFCWKVNRRNFKFRDNFDGLLTATLDGNTL